MFWGGFNTAMEATNTMSFCISCHEMKDNVYKEYATTIHYQNRTGVSAACSDCHVPKDWVHKVIRKVQASNELLHHFLGTVNTPEKFDGKRLKLASNVWASMKATDSRECRNCHTIELMNPEFQRPRARKQHLEAMKVGNTCIDCHKGIAHKSVRAQVDDKTLEELEKPLAAYIRQIPATYTEGLARADKRESGLRPRARKAEIDSSSTGACYRADEGQGAAAAAPAPGCRTGSAGPASPGRSRRGGRSGERRRRLERHRGQDRHAVLSRPGLLRVDPERQGARRRARLPASR